MTKRIIKKYSSKKYSKLTADDKNNKKNTLNPQMIKRIIQHILTKNILNSQFITRIIKIL